MEVTVALEHVLLIKHTGDMSTSHSSLTEPVRKKALKQPAVMIPRLVVWNKVSKS